MLRGILISLLASLLFGYMYYFSTLLKPLSGTDIFGYRMLFTFPFVALSVIMFKQKQALVEHLKRIKNRPLFALSYIICTISQACSGVISLNDMVCSFCALFIHAIKNNQAHRQY